MKKLIILLLCAISFFAQGQQQTINIGSAPNDHTGDPLRTAFTKVNSNFTQLFNGTWGLRQGTNTLNQNLNFDGAFNVGIGQVTPLISLNAATASGVYNSSLNLNSSSVGLSFNDANSVNYGFSASYDFITPGDPIKSWGAFNGGNNLIYFGYDNLGAGARGVTIYTGTSAGSPTKRFQITEAGLWTANFGSDATGDIHYRNSSGNLVRLPIGSSTQVLTVTGGVPVWAAAAGGGGNPFADNAALVKNNADATKLLIFSAASITTGTTRTWTFPDVNGTVARKDAAQTFTGIQDFSSSPTIPTPSALDNSTKAINSAYVDGASGKIDKLAAFNRQTASYTLVLGDAGKVVEQNVGSANNLTVPLNSSVAYPVGTQITVTNYGAGQVTIVATGGVTLRSAGGKLKLTQQYSSATLIKVGTDEWYVIGDLSL